MSKKINIVIYGMDKKLWDEFRALCMEDGMAIAGRNAKLSQTLQDIIRSYIASREGKEGKGKSEGGQRNERIKQLKDALDVTIVRRQMEYAPPALVEGIVRTHMHIVSQNLIRYYASLCGYTYDRKRKAYKTPYTPASITPDTAVKTVLATLGYYALKHQK